MISDINDKAEQIFKQFANESDNTTDVETILVFILMIMVVVLLIV